MLLGFALGALMVVPTVDRSGSSSSLSVAPGASASASILAADHPRLLSVVVSIDRPGRLKPGAPVEATLSVGPATLKKTLHLGDPDVAWTIRPDAGQAATVSLKADPKLAEAISCTVRTAEHAESPDGVAFEHEPNDTPAQANRLDAGRTVYGLADDRPYLPLGETPTPAEQSAGQDWYRLDFDADTPRLLYVGIDYTDRDVPPDVRVYTLDGAGKPVEYTKGIDPQSLQRERPPRPGANKFTTRVLTKGTYYILVDACHPEYQLRTKLLDPPPYLKNEEADDATKVAEAARKAVRSAMDFQLLAGDSWHANTPRKGQAMDRVANVHHEVSTCVGCHPTHFTTQSTLTAVRNGYGIEQPFAAKFLFERLANNPVPFHGHDQAVWARMIPAPANVLGRLSTILMDEEDLLKVTHRDHTHRAISEFLALYYDGRKTIPPDESNGNNPVSRYKVATDAWRQLDLVFKRTGDPEVAATRDVVARILPTGKPDNPRDLAAQTIGLCLSDPEENKAKIAENVAWLLKIQRPDGHWAIKFGPNQPLSEMQTGESLYALSLAGLGADHPAVRKGIIALLTEQKPFGAWFDTNPYEQFQTPFRETQWSLMAISRLYPGPGTSGWDNPLGPQPKSLRADSESHLIADLERIWDAPGPGLEAEIVRALDHPSPLIRLAACSALSRVGSASSTAAILARLGDESKVVRRAAADAARQLGDRLWTAIDDTPTPERIAFRKALASVLASGDDRARRGATRLFAAHFRDLSRDTTLADALLARLDDADPVVRMQAIKGLWRFWYWQSDSALRNKIEDALIDRLGRPEHPWVRRNLVEALYIIGDENIRYFYNNWLPSLADDVSRGRATAAQHATVNRLAEKYVVALKGDSTLRREGVLRALSEFHERPEGTGRIGNDIEPILFYEDALPKLSAALLETLASPEPTARRLALQAMATLRGHRDPALARAVAARLGDADPGVREWAATMAKEFPLDLKPGRAEPATIALVDELLSSPIPDARASGLALVGRVGPVKDAPFDRSDAVISRVKDADPAVRAAAVRALASFPKRLEDAAVRSMVRDTLKDQAPEPSVAATRLALARSGLVPERALRAALDRPEPDFRIALLTSIAADKRKAADDLRLVNVVSAALGDENGGVREKALAAIQAAPTMINNPAVEEGLREVTRSENPRQKEIARSLLASRGRSSGVDAGKDLLDLAYFEAKVLPIFNAMADDGQNCVGCHRSHTVLRLLPPGKDGTFAAATVRANYRAALGVVNLASPADSLLLNKPTWEAAEEAEAQNDPSKKAHSGGIRFDARTSREYQTILDWINGAKLPAKSASASR
jgi:HEAT repeat protein